MRQLFTLFTFLFFTTSFMAQTVIQPDVVAVEGITILDSDVVGHSLVVNQSSEEQDYIWTREIVQIGQGWNTAVCDVNLCHGPSLDEAPFSLAPGQEGTLDVHVYPNGFEGAAIVSVTVINQNDAEDTATASYFFNQSLSVAERITNALRIYPNPVVSQFFIEGADNVQRVEIYNISGKLVKEVQSFGQGAINVDDLGTGNYIVRMWDDANTQISTNVLTVQ